MTSRGPWLGGWRDSCVAPDIHAVVTFGVHSASERAMAQGFIMSTSRTTLRRLALAGWLTTAGASQAAITVYTTEASFLAAVTAAATDSFDDLLPGQGYDSPLARSAGSYEYSASAGPDSPRLYGAGSAGDAWLSTNIATDSVTFSGFSSGVSAAGGFFFGSDIAGEFLRRGSITVTASDASSSASRTVNFAQQGNFIGFVSDTSLVSMTVSSSFRSTRTPVWLTVDDLTLATPVPEPKTYAMMLSGLAVLLFLARRRRRD